MLRVERLFRAVEQTTLRAARQSQGVLIMLVDRLARDEETQRPRPLGRMWRVQLDIAGLTIGEPTRVVDAAFAHSQQLLSLHREFANRLFEAIGTRELAEPLRNVEANVVPLVRRAGA